MLPLEHAPAHELDELWRQLGADSFVDEHTEDDGSGPLVQVLQRTGREIAIAQTEPVGLIVLMCSSTVATKAGEGKSLCLTVARDWAEVFCHFIR